ncbi:MAG: aldo/keto reductase [Bacteroidia bacterium]|nr:aldo/keto reductase [Bacteroidia bacterium]
MQYRYLGKSGLQLSVFSLGSWLTIGKSVDLKFSSKLMHYAYDNGINFFDSAEGYAGGQAEIVMGQILKKAGWERSSYIVSSKVFYGTKGDNNKPNEKGLSRKHIVEACHAALKRMQVDYLDLYLCHRPDPNVPMAEVVFTMNHLMQQGKILYWGTSEWSAAEIMEAHAVARQNNLQGPVVEQPEYNMFVRTKMERDFLPIFKNTGLGTTIWSPLNSGMLTGKYLNGIPKNSRFDTKGLEWLRDKELLDNKLRKIKLLQKLADKTEMQLGQMALAWCLKNPNVTTVILGASTLQQLQQNINALPFVAKLNEELMQKIETILQTNPLK